jgi:hypothetical protein
VAVTVEHEVWGYLSRHGSLLRERGTAHDER